MAPGFIIDVDEPIHVDLTSDPPTIDLTTSDTDEEPKHATTQPLPSSNARGMYV